MITPRLNVLVDLKYYILKIDFFTRVEKNQVKSMLIRRTDKILEIIIYGMKVYGHTQVGVRGQLESFLSAMWVSGIERKSQAPWYHPAYPSFYFETIRTPLPQLRLIPT